MLWGRQKTRGDRRAKASATHLKLVACEKHNIIADGGFYKQALAVHPANIAVGHNILRRVGTDLKAVFSTILKCAVHTNRRVREQHRRVRTATVVGNVGRLVGFHVGVGSVGHDDGDLVANHRRALAAENGAVKRPAEAAVSS